MTHTTLRPAMAADHELIATQAHRLALELECLLLDTLRQCPHNTVENLRVRWLYAKDFARAIEAAHGIKGEA